MKKEKKFLRGSEDIQRVFSTLKDQESKARRAAWLKENYKKPSIEALNIVKQSEGTSLARELKKEHLNEDHS